MPLQRVGKAHKPDGHDSQVDDTAKSATRRITSRFEHGYKYGMPVVETLTVTVGASVAKWIVGEWLGDGLRKELASGFADVLAARVPDFMQRRSLRRQMDQIAESSAEKLARLVEIEFRNLDEGEQNAAVNAASESLSSGLGATDITALDYDPIRLKEHLEGLSVDRLGPYALSYDALRLYNLILVESSNYIVEVVSTLPSFTANASVEILRRESALIDMVREIYERLPDPRATAEAEAAATAEFETDYRRYIARRLDRLELFGLSVSEFSSRYALSVAYITLNVKRGTIGYGIDREIEEQTKFDEIDEGVNVRVDEAIGASKRIFVRGAAGSGKTTLLQWVAVNSARNEFEGPMADWNGGIPFFLQLRRFSKRGFPQPSDFLAFTGPGMLERAPAGWVVEQLSLGRAQLLIDGVDEVAESDRSKVRKWLDDLVAAYPECRYVITSRPAAVPEDWLSGEGFDSVDLQPMMMSDIQEFVAHWHHAAARNTTDTEEHLTQLSRYQSALIETIGASRQIRSLATSPLLCAMLCALNRDRRTRLPKDRVELYRIALEMLLERRDLEREVLAGGGSSISLPEKLILLRELAYWLVLNEQSDAEYELVVERFAHRLKFMPGLNWTAEGILKYLLVRSGLLREPVQGRIDFIHRTFQEYLAAVEVSELGNIPMLVARANEDNWREVVILTAGTSHSRQKSELFDGLLRRGRDEPEHQHTLYLLAVACLETAREVPPALAEDIGNCLNELLPPNNFTEAKELASAGELALSRLSEYRRANAPQAAACVRAACLIGGEASLPVLAKYATDPRKRVQRELMRGWAMHDQPREYSERVLRNSPLIDGVANITDPSLIPFVSNLAHMRDLEIVIRGVPANLDLLRTMPQLTYFDARGNRRISDLSFLSESQNLLHLDLERCSDVESLTPLAKLTDLLLLDASYSKVRDISVLRGMKRLSWLGLAGCQVIDWEPLRACTNLVTAYLMNCPSLVSLDFVSGWSRLERLSVDRTGISSLAPLATLAALSRVSATYCPNLADVGALDGNKTLGQLFLSGNRRLASIESLSNMPALSSLRVEDCSNLQRFPSSAGWPRLRFLFLCGCPKLSDINFLETLPELRAINLKGSAVSDLRPLSNATKLTNVFLEECKNVEDISPLSGLPQLSSVDLRGAGDVDLGQLGGSFRTGLTVSVLKSQKVYGASSFEKSGGRVRVFRPLPVRVLPS